MHGSTFINTQIAHIYATGARDTTAAVLRPFIQNNPGQLVPEETYCIPSSGFYGTSGILI